MKRLECQINNGERDNKQAKSDYSNHDFSDKVPGTVTGSRAFGVDLDGWSTVLEYIFPLGSLFQERFSGHGLGPFFIRSFQDGMQVSCHIM